jgi:hypothetical protein
MSIAVVNMEPMARNIMPTNITPKAIELTEEPTVLGMAYFIKRPINIQNNAVKLEKRPQ